MRGILIAVLVLSFASADPLFTTNNDTAWKNWHALRGVAQADDQVRRDRHATLRLESNGAGGAYVASDPVSLRIGRQYELTGWIRSDHVLVRDTDRSPIAVGATLSMASMPFDVHSESIGGTRDWTRLSIRFIATRAQDRIALSVGAGGEFTGRAWFEGISIDEASTEGNWPSKAALKTYGPAYRYPSAGWIYLHIEGKPYERGYQHGRLMAPEIETYIDRCAAQLDANSRATAWSNGRSAANALFLRGFDKEILEEMKGIADGAAAAGCRYQGRPVDLIDIVTANTIVELGELASSLQTTPTGLEGIGQAARIRGSGQRGQRSLQRVCRYWQSHARRPYADCAYDVVAADARRTNERYARHSAHDRASRSDAVLSRRHRERHGLVSERCRYGPDGNDDRAEPVPPGRNAGRLSCAEGDPVWRQHR